jgi:hypothetical protein
MSSLLRRAARASILARSRADGSTCRGDASVRLGAAKLVGANCHLTTNLAPQGLCAPGGAERLREKQRSATAATPLRSLLRFTSPHCNKYDSYSRARRQGFAEKNLDTAHALKTDSSTRACVPARQQRPSRLCTKTFFVRSVPMAKGSTNAAARSARAIRRRRCKLSAAHDWLSIVRVTSSGLRCSTTERIPRFSLRI